MKEKIFTEKEILEQLDLEKKLFQDMLKRNLIRSKGTADGNVLIFSEDSIDRIREVRQFLSMGYSIDEIEKISKKVGLPSTKKESEPDGKKIRYLTVGELASQLGINGRTIKYWEERGVIEPDSRSEGGFRLYSEQWIYLCNLIKDLQLFGYSLEEIKEISDLFRDFLTIQNSIDHFPKNETKQKLENMKTKIGEFHHKIESFKEGISRWEELLKKKDKEIRQFENKLKQQSSEKKDKEKKE